MENTIDLRKTGAENIIGKFSKKHSSQHIIPVRENGSFIVGATFYMTARQAETILMLSDFGKRPSGDSKHCEDRESEANVMREKHCVRTCNACSLWLKALQVYLL
jgi:hypothetical protein